MKKTIHICCFLFLFGNLYAQNVSFSWAKQMGGNGAAGAGNALALDAAGNVYVAGGFSGTIDFDPGPGIYNLTSRGISDIFISKVNPAGDLVWVEQIGKKGIASGFGLTLDAAGSIYITGSFDSTVDFDPGVGVYELSTAAGDGDVFIMKLASNGNFVFAKQIGGSGGDFGYAISVSTTGNIYTTGFTQGTVDFDPGPGVYDLTSWGMFVSMLDASGNFRWARTMTGTGYSEPHSMVLDAAGKRLYHRLVHLYG